AGPIIALVWAAVAVLGWGGALTHRVRGGGWATSPNRATAAAFLIALATTSLAAWRVEPMIPGGDEPHYLIATQSLLTDRDLKIENNHARGDYYAYASGELHPQYLVRGRNGEIYPVHAPGLPALAMPAFALGGYPGVVIFLLIVMALASALTWRLAWLATSDMRAAWFGWAAVAASATWVFQSFLVFPDALGGAAVACGVWLVLRLDLGARPSRPAAAAVGAALAMLPWLHTRFAVCAAGLGVMIALRLWRLGPRHLVWFAAVPAIGALGWFAFFQSIYGTPSPIAQWGGTGGSSLAWIPSGLMGLLFDQQFGLLPYAPVLALGLAGLTAGTAAGWLRSTRLQLLLLVVIPYVVASASYAMWWAGHSVPARLLTVLLPVLAPAGAVLWMRASHPVLRSASGSALGWTIFVTIALAFADRGELAWNIRQHKAGLLFEWLAPLAQWTEALPAFFRAADGIGRESLPQSAFYMVTGIWLLVMGAALGAAAMISRMSSRVRASALTVTALIAAVPFATVLALRADGANGAAPVRAGVEFLSRVAQTNSTVVDLAGRRAIDATDAVTRLRLDIPPQGIGPLAAGHYRITGDPAGAPGEIRIGRGQAGVGVLGDSPEEIVLPVAVNALIVRGAAGRRIWIEALSVPARRWRQHALRAARYGDAVVYFLDDRSYAEGDAFWIGGARHANVVVQGDPGVRSVLLEIRNAPVPNHVVVTGAGPVARDLAPGETLVVPVTLDAGGAARLQIDSRSGFVPAEVDQTAGDRRFLGVYVRIVR
ncbi:MAG: hypothetical protein M3R55_13475, partial [Acidobacteriota bacterium]|nr:hypothetical protein [Acidobacteriota bacterium]